MFSARARVLLVTATGVLILLAVAGALWWQRVNRTPVVAAPAPPRMPSPNAYDYYVAAANELRDARCLFYATDDRKRPPLPPIPMPGASPGSAVRDPLDRIWSHTEKQALLMKNAAAIKLLRGGLAHGYRYPPVGSLLQNVPLGQAELIHLAQLLVLDAQVRAGKRDWQGTAASCLDAVQFGAQTPRGAPLSIGFVGVNCRKYAEKELWKITDRLTAAQARVGVRRMEAVMAQRVPFAEMLREEKACGQQTLLEIFQKPNWRGWFLENACDLPATKNSVQLAAVLVQFYRRPAWSLLTCSRQATLAQYTKTMDQWIAWARQPYAAKTPLPKKPTNPFSDMMVWPFEGEFFRETKARAGDALMTIALALRAYRLEHGRYPARVDELVPSYLKMVPDDPFALNGPPRYRRRGDGYVLYSIGPDGRDDGGVPVVNPKMPGDRHYVEQNSRGDIVVGVNAP